jgi:hypothetical protein
MPTTERREDRIIRLFLSAFEENSWKNASLDFQDKRMDGTVEVVATRLSDGATLAVEHTLIEPFIDDRKDLAQFTPAFERVQADVSLSVPDRITYVYVPVGALDRRKAEIRRSIVSQIHEFLKTSIAAFEEGWSHPQLKISLSSQSSIDLTLTVHAISSPDYSAFRIARQQVSINLDKVIEKALRKKLPKLVRTSADRRILMFERAYMNLLPEQIIGEINRLRPLIPEFAKVDDLWIAETMFYEKEDAIEFLRYDDKVQTTGHLGFYGGKINHRWKKGMPNALTH